MHINATLFGEILTFVILVYFTMKYIWPQLIGKIEERREFINNGIESSIRSEKLLEITKNNSLKLLTESKLSAKKIISDAELKASILISENRKKLISEQKKSIKKTNLEILSLYDKAQKNMKKEMLDLSIVLTEKILKNSINKEINSKIIDSFVDEIEQGNIDPYTDNNI